MSSSCLLWWPSGFALPIVGGGRRAGLYSIRLNLSIAGEGRRAGLFPTPDGKRAPLAGRRYGVYDGPPVLGPIPFECFPNWTPNFFSDTSFPVD